MDAKTLIYLFPALAVLALIYAYIKAAWVRRQDPGNDRMQMIGGWIADGAMAFLGPWRAELAVRVLARVAVFMPK